EKNASVSAKGWPLTEMVAPRIGDVIEEKLTD
ncbi:MAG: hypothetical protein ACI9TF_001151, partial [Paracrocinitomix sp.]